jgi:hypothetical protein
VHRDTLGDLLDHQQTKCSEAQCACPSNRHEPTLERANLIVISDELGRALSCLLEIGLTLALARVGYAGTARTVDCRHTGRCRFMLQGDVIRAGRP